MGDTKQVAVILSKRDAEKYKAIIERAALNGYHDFKFDTIPGHPEYGECICPKMQLVEDLGKFPELVDVQKQVMNGDFDEHGDAEDTEMMRGWLLDDNSPDKIFELLGFKIPTKEEREQRPAKKILN